MEEVENQTLNLLKNLIENREKIYNKIEEAKEKLIPIVNIINICISGECLLLESEMVEYVKWSDK